MDSDRIQNLQMIGGVIQRMAQNSFALKGWCTTLIAAILALAAKDSDPRVAVVALLPTVVFWLLDAYYLWQERRFRELYEKVRSADSSIPAFSMDTSGEKHVKFSRSLRSHVVWPFYAVMMVVSIIVFAMLVYYPHVTPATNKSDATTKITLYRANSPGSTLASTSRQCLCAALARRRCAGPHI